MGDESKGVLSIIAMITQDLQDEITNAMKDEEAAQLQFEKALAAAEKLEADLGARKLSLQEMIALREAEKTEELKKKGINEAELKDELDYKAKITTDCDWIIRAFSQRAEKRAAEMSGLSGAKDYLAAANEAALLQQKKKMGKHFDDEALSKI